MMLLFVFIPFLLLASINDLLHFKMINTDNNLNLKSFHIDINRYKNLDLNISNKLDLAKYEYYNNDLGVYLDVSGGINDRKFRSFLYTGVSWKLLNDGYREHKSKANILLLKNKLKQLNNQNIDKSFSYYNDFNFIIYFYNTKKIELLNEYLKFLNIKFDIFKKRYYLHQVNLEKLLLIKQNINNILNLQDTYKKFNQKVLYVNNIKGDIPDFDLNYQSILNDLNESNKSLKIKLNNKIIDYKYDKFNKWSLSIYANRDLLNNKGDNLGFSLSVPLFENQQELQKLEKLQNVSKIKQENIRLYLYLQKNYYVFKYKLNDLINMRFKLAYVKAQLDRAKLRYRFHIGQDNMDRILSNITSLFNIQLQLLDIKQQLLLKTYSLLFNLNLDIQNRYIKRINVDTKLQLRKGNRSIYIWANGFKKYDNDILIQLLKVKNIKTALISVSKYEDFEKLKNFLKLAKKNNINVQFLIGNNNWIYPKNRKKIDKKLNLLKQYNNYVLHLDIEPQAMADLKHNKQIYIKMYLDMIKYIANKYPMYKLNIAIPTYYPVNYVIRISNYVDKIYLMAYEYKNIDQLIRKVNKYKILEDKLVIVFNCKEFQNEYELETDIDEFISKSGYKDIALHNLKEYIKVSQ